MMVNVTLRCIGNTYIHQAVKQQLTVFVNVVLTLVDGIMILFSDVKFVVMVVTAQAEYVAPAQHKL